MHSTIIIIFLLLPVIAGAQPSQWRGPARNGHFPDTGLLKSWPKEGPELILKLSGIGMGFSSPIEHMGTIYVTGKKDTMDLLAAIDPEGEIKWQVPYGHSWTSTYTNTRSTPTLEDNRIYLISGTGRLVCLDSETGKEIWSAEPDLDFEAEWHNWGVAESLLIVDDMVICSPAGKQTTMVAYNKYTGALVWKSEPTGGKRSYVSPVLYEYNDLRLILGMTTMDLYGVMPETGKILWTYPYYTLNEDRRNRGGDIMTNTPLFKGYDIFITTGYNYPSVMLRLAEDGKSVSEKWRNHTLDNHHGHAVLIGDKLYSSNWKDNSNGNWICLDWDTGEVLWVRKWHTKGSIITADDMLYIFEEKDGNVGLLKHDSDRFKLYGKFQITEGEGPYWAHPSIFNGKLLIRHGDYLFVYNIHQ